MTRIDKERWSRIDRLMGIVLGDKHELTDGEIFFLSGKLYSALSDEPNITDEKLWKEGIKLAIEGEIKCVRRKYNAYKFRR